LVLQEVFGFALFKQAFESNRNAIEEPQNEMYSNVQLHRKMASVGQCAFQNSETK